MIQVIALVCTLMAPLQCKHAKLSFAATTPTPFECMQYGQVELAKWTNEHPGWAVVHGFTCGPAGRYANL